MAKHLLIFNDKTRYKLNLTYKMLIISLAISLFNVLKVNALECLSVINRKCIPRPKILDIDEGIGEALFYSYMC